MIFEEFVKEKEGRKMAFAACAGDQRGWGIGVVVLGESGYYTIDKIEGVEDKLGIMQRFSSFAAAQEHADHLNVTCFKLTGREAAEIIASSMAPKKKKK